MGLMGANVSMNKRQAFENKCTQILTTNGYRNIELYFVGSNRGRIVAKKGKTEFYVEYQSISLDGLPSPMCYSLMTSLSSVLANVDLTNADTRDKELLLQFGLEGIHLLCKFQRKFQSVDNYLIAQIDYNDDIIRVEFYTSEITKHTTKFSDEVSLFRKEKTIDADFDSMDGHEFEQFCADILEKNRFKNITVTRGSGDQGIDIIAHKDGIKYGIQCKCYSSDIGNKAVQEVFAGKTFYQCHVGIVLTNRYFTKSAKSLAEVNGVILWDRDRLIELVEEARKSNV